MFRIDGGSGVPIYRQLMEQVRCEVMLGRLQPGDQLPTLREVVDTLAINPNTVVKAYTELEHEGLVVRRQGMGTFVAPALPSGVLAAPPALQAALLRWVHRAQEAGLSREQIRLLVAAVLDEGTADNSARQATDGVA
jgi:GntR family transcriptional regulator